MCVRCGSFDRRIGEVQIGRITTDLNIVITARRFGCENETVGIINGPVIDNSRHDIAIGGIDSGGKFIQCRTRRNGHRDLGAGITDLDRKRTRRRRHRCQMPIFETLRTYTMSGCQLINHNVVISIQGATRGRDPDGGIIPIDNGRLIELGRS